MLWDNIGAEITNRSESFVHDTPWIIFNEYPWGPLCPSIHVHFHENSCEPTQLVLNNYCYKYNNRRRVNLTTACSTPLVFVCLDAICLFVWLLVCFLFVWLLFVCLFGCWLFVRTFQCSRLILSRPGRICTVITMMVRMKSRSGEINIKTLILRSEFSQA